MFDPVWTPATFIFGGLSLLWFFYWLDAKKTIAKQRRLLDYHQRLADATTKLNNLLKESLANDTVTKRRLRKQLVQQQQDIDELEWHNEHLAALNDRLTDRLQQAQEDYRHAKFHATTWRDRFLARGNVVFDTNTNTIKE